MKISFIIIGKNEGWKLTKCFESVFNYVRLNGIIHYEIVYVDSKSTDDSIEIAKSFNDIKIFQITGECNAAIGRNIGANESTGEILFFIDGDMKIQADFYNSVFDSDGKLKFNFVSGNLYHYNYDNSWNFKYKEAAFLNLNNDRKEYSLGGIFILKRDLWFLVNGMKNNMIIFEDLDLGLRLSKAGYPLIRKKEFIAIHHTIPYSDIKRSFRSLIGRSEFSFSVLLREYFFNSFYLKEHFFKNINFYVLLIILPFLFLSYNSACYLFIFYLILLAVRSLKVVGFSFKFFLRFIYYFLRDLIRLFSFIFFYPSNNIKIEYFRI
jgi:glycosyltransferase involved in cell wall biosynthesis